METYQKLDSIEKIAETSSIQTYRIKSKKSVKEILNQLNLEQNFFAVLVNGKRVALSDVIGEDAEIVILPKIAGG